jgi:hypothetical protein
MNPKEKNRSKLLTWPAGGYILDEVLARDSNMPVMSGSLQIIEHMEGWGR